MYLPKPPKNSGITVRRLLEKRNCLSCEVDQLSKELQFLKENIRNKQDKMRKINIEIIYRSMSISHLSIVARSELSLDCNKLVTTPP